MFLLCPKVINLLILVRVVSFLLAFLHCDNTYPSNLKSLSMRIPKSFCCLFSQIFVCPALSNVSYLCPENRTFLLIHYHIIRFKPLCSKGRIMLQPSYKTFKGPSHKHGKLYHQHNDTHQSSPLDKINR